MTDERREAAIAKAAGAPFGRERWESMEAQLRANRIHDAELIIDVYEAALGTDEQTVWTCMSCGGIGEAQSCWQCGAEARPGRWVRADATLGGEAEGEHAKRWIEKVAALDDDRELRRVVTVAGLIVGAQEALARDHALSEHPEPERRKAPNPLNSERAQRVRERMAADDPNPFDAGERSETDEREADIDALAKALCRASGGVWKHLGDVERDNWREKARREVKAAEPLQDEPEQEEIAPGVRVPYAPPDPPGVQDGGEREAMVAPAGQEHPSWSRHAYLCGACGEVSYADDWLAFKHDDDGGLIPAEDGDNDPIIRCPICKTDHKDADDDTGVWAGTRKEMYAERDTQLQNPIIADAWIGFWKGRAEHPHQDVEPPTHFEWPEHYEHGEQQTTACAIPLDGRRHTSYRKEVTCVACLQTMLEAQVGVRVAAEQELERLREALILLAAAREGSVFPDEIDEATDAVIQRAHQRGLLAPRSVGGDEVETDLTREGLEFIRAALASPPDEGER